MNVDYLIVGGGAGGGSTGSTQIAGGGGGAGQVLTGTDALTTGSFGVTVGAGGAGVGFGATGGTGGSSVFHGHTAAGGLGGDATGTGGASGGGQSGGSVGDNFDAGGGGGDSGSGGNGSVGVTGGNGGSGTSSSLSGTATTYATGGGGAGYSGGGAGGPAGDGVGANVVSSPSPATAGNANTGNGGGGANNVSNSGAGGSGVVVLRYLTALASSTGGTPTTSGPYTIVTFTSSGTFALNVYVAGALSGSGTMAGAGASTAKAVGSMGGSGTMTGFATGLQPAVGSMSGAGAMAGVRAPIFAALTAAGAYSGKDTVLAWVEFDLPGVGTYAWSGVAITDPSTYYHGYKEARVLVIQDLTIAFSDVRGNFQATTCVFELNDTPDPTRANSGMLVRGWLGAGRALRNANVRIRLLTNAQRLIGAVPITVFTGIVQRHTAGDPYVFTFECSGWMFPRLNQNVTDLTVAGFFPKAPSASQPLPPPIALGLLSDEAPGGANAPVPVLESATGCTAAAAAATYVSPVAPTRPIYGNIPSTVALAGFGTMPGAAPGPPTSLALTSEAASVGAPSAWPGSGRNQESGYRIQVRSIKSAAVGPVSVDYLIVGGGGGGGSTGGSQISGGGGGGGQVLTGTDSLATGSHAVVVGAGGAGVGFGANGGAGGTSSHNGHSAGGGAGGLSSGGGGASGSGHAGGTAGDNYDAGGGGGDSASGGNGGVAVNGGHGGAGTASSLSGASVTYGTGGGGSGCLSGFGGAGGPTGDGVGASLGTAGGPCGGGPPVSATAGSANTGDGGGGANNVSNSGAGGSGLVVLRYLTSAAIISSGGTAVISGPYTIVTFTASGTFTLSRPFVAGDPTPFLLESASALDTLPGANYQIDVNWSAPAGGADSYEVMECQLAVDPSGTSTAYRPEQIVPVVSAGMGSGGGNGIYAVPSATVTPIDASSTNPTSRAPDFASRYVYCATAVLSAGEASPSVPWINRPTPWARPVRLCWSPVVGATLYYVYRADLGTDGSIGTFIRRWTVPTSQVNGSGNLFFQDDLMDTGVTIVTGIGGGSSLASGVVPPVNVGGPWVDNTGTSWDLAFAVAAHAVKGGFTLYSHDSTGAVTALASLDDTQVSCPGRTGFAARWGAAYRVVGGVRWTLIYVRGALAANLTSGAVTLWANFSGAEKVGDGSGVLLTQLPDQLALLADNLLLADSPNLGAANWAAAPPTFSDGAPRRDVASFAAASASGAIVMPAGMDGSRWLASVVTWSQLLAELLLSGAMKAAENGAGALQLFVTNPTAAPTATIDEKNEVLVGAFSFIDTDQGYANSLPYAFLPVYSAGGSAALQLAGQLEDAVSQAKYGERIVDTTASLTWRRDPTQAAQTAARLLAESTAPPRIASLQGGLHWLALSLGQIVAVTHRQGANSFGWTANPAEIRGMRVSLDSHTVGLTCSDMIELAGTSMVVDLMSNTSLGGSADASIGRQTGTVSWAGARIVAVNWDQIPQAYRVVARIWTKQAAGASQTPIINDVGSNWAGSTLVATGTLDAGTGWTMQTITLPRVTGTHYYGAQSTLAGASALDVWVLGGLEVTL